MSTSTAKNRIQDIIAQYKAAARPFTYQDYLALPDTGDRYEILKGELIMVAAPNTMHQIVSGNLEFIIRTFFKKQPVGIVLDAPCDVVLSEINVVQPDILVILKKRKAIIQHACVQGAPDWIIEILSPASQQYDFGLKKAIYEEHGVKEYWIVHPKEQWIEQYVLQGNALKLSNRLEQTGRLASHVVAGLQVDLKEVFDYGIE